MSCYPRVINRLICFSEVELCFSFLSGKIECISGPIVLPKIEVGGAQGEKKQSQVQEAMRLQGGGGREGKEEGKPGSKKGQGQKKAKKRMPPKC